MMHPSLLQRVMRRLDKSVSSLFFIDQWVIMTAQGMDHDALRWAGLRPIIPEADRYWGDPFVMQKDDQYFVFVEEKIYAKGRGHIACLTLDSEGRLLTHRPVLERDYHLSYPHVFEQRGQIFMIPETAGNRAIELYRCTHFPDRWELERTLMANVYAVDATLLDYQGGWWLFANIKEPGGSSLNALHLFSARDLSATDWIPHPCNPVVRDIRSARPAGRIFMHEGRLIRPSQDSSRRYGYGLRFNHITKLTQDAYEEELESTFEPPGGKLLATHTFNQAGGLTVIDAVLRRRK